MAKYLSLFFQREQLGYEISYSIFLHQNKFRYIYNSRKMGGSSIVSIAAAFLCVAFVIEARIIGRRLRDGEACSTPGFFGDAEDCRKFYRCAEHPTEDENNPHLIRYTFRCPNGTVFDEALSTCNHPEAVMNKPENCQVYDPAEEDQSMNGNGGSLRSPSVNGVLNQFLIGQQPQQQTVLLSANHQLLYPTLTLPSYGNFIQYG